MDDERKKHVENIELLKHHQKLREKLKKTEDELFRIFHYMIFWPQGYKIENPETGKRQNPKITFGPGGRGSRSFSMTMTREDLDQSYTFIFMTRSIRTLPESKAGKNWKLRKKYDYQEDTYTEPHDCVVGNFGFRVIELVESDVEGLDVTQIPHEAIVTVTKQYAENCL